jgi:acetyl/propionyl-CoA carboxylase alpha subunit
MMQMASIGIHAENNGEYMYVSSADEFLDLSKHCSMDSYSKGKTVVINSDIDFT